jgi:hypothetical protein
MRVVFKKNHPITLLSMMGLMIFASASFEHRPVVCLQFLPGLDVRLTCHAPLIHDEAFLNETWLKIQSELLEWVDRAPPALPSDYVASNGVRLQLLQSGTPSNEAITFSREWY